MFSGTMPNEHQAAVPANEQIRVRFARKTEIVAVVATAPKPSPTAYPLEVTGYNNDNIEMESEELPQYAVTNPRLQQCPQTILGSDELKPFSRIEKPPSEKQYLRGGKQTTSDRFPLSTTFTNPSTYHNTLTLGASNQMSTDYNSNAQQTFTSTSNVKDT